MSIQIKAPTRLRNVAKLHGAPNPFYRTTWMELDIDRIEFSVDNSIKDYPQPDEETSIMQVSAGKQIINLTGYFTADSEFVGVGVTEKAKNLVLAARYWYFGIRAKSIVFPHFVLLSTSSKAS